MQDTKAIIPEPASSLLSFVQSNTGQNISSCYQCGKCSAGCPTAYAMDIGPRQVMRAIQLGLKDEILGSSAIWLCVSCQTCSVRCPREIDIARVIESLRLLSQAEGTPPAQREIAVFHRAFLQQVRIFGRLYEVGLGIMYNLRSGHFFNNMNRLPSLFAKKKLRLIPQRTKGVSDARRIAARVKKLESELK
ncbi:MAG TPA: heterodisulfide reductase subunit C [Dehalococcoidia bacterium]|nr:heterodisulfide reductase subunit C [Dehalococcoidia bacterium]